MANHHWIPAKSSQSTRFERWTHICKDCLCRKGTSKLPGRGVRPLYRLKGEYATETRPECPGANPVIERQREAMLEEHTRRVHEDDLQVQALEEELAENGIDPGWMKEDVDLARRDGYIQHITNREAGEIDEEKGE